MFEQGSGNINNNQTTDGVHSNVMNKSTSPSENVHSVSNVTQKSNTSITNSPLQNSQQKVINDPLNVPSSPKLHLTSQSKTFLAGGFTLFFAFLLILGAIRPTIADIIRIRNQLKTYKEIAIKLDEKIDTIYELKDELDKRKSTLAYFDVYYPHNLDYSLFVSNLEYIAKEEKASLVSVNYSENVGSEYVKKFKQKGITAISPVVFAITIEGDYNQLITFLKQLEETPYLPQVLTMGYRADRPDQKRTFTLNVLLFRLKAPIVKLKSNEDILEYVSSQE